MKTNNVSISQLCRKITMILYNLSFTNYTNFFTNYTNISLYDRKKEPLPLFSALFFI